MSNKPTCKYCDRPITDQGDLCAWHLDLEVLIDYLKDKKQSVTITALALLITVCLSRKSSLVVTLDDLDELITPEFAGAYEITTEPTATPA